MFKNSWLNDAVKEALYIEGQPDDPEKLVFIDNFGQLLLSRLDSRYGRESTIISDPRPNRCAICGNGWEQTYDSLKNQVDVYDAPKGKKFAHESCYIGHLSMVQHGLFASAICEARITYEGLEEIPNQYGGAWNTPWYTAKLIGVLLPREYRTAVKDRKEFAIQPSLTLGRRKRVYSLELTSPVLIPLVSAPETKGLFEDDVTKGFGGRSSYGDMPEATKAIMIHAWGDEKVFEYMKAFAHLLSNTEGNWKT